MSEKTVYREQQKISLIQFLLELPNLMVTAVLAVPSRSPIVWMAVLDSLGYVGSGDKIRGFEHEQLYSEVATKVMDTSTGSPRSGYHWIAYDVDAPIVGNSATVRLDYKYWDVEIRNRIEDLLAKGHPMLKELNQIETSRGRSPSSDSYVDEDEGFAVVVKAGSNISRFGTLVLEGADWIEKSAYDEYVEKANDNHYGATL